ncbi:signal peptidase I [Gracilibacillus caseinilyticus]|uniref:Signal peptidase I n=1 Tax=Gracilibacillus caseinilyticus TaxID=2932256 RepID=A0ABY4EV03_9BACI|nr:signal peptidase I [Gracilibacillus caseinilyticus]UOQ47896.1 signal peptidase I [Gracilibacillus caseinilyticus]
MKEKKKDWVDWLKTIIITVLIVIFIRIFIAVPIVVDGPSMLPTLENNDRLIVNKFSLLIGEPDRFDVVVFHATAKRDYIKRVIGLPGDKITYKDDQLYVNGNAVEEPFIDEQIAKDESKYTTNFSLEDIPGNIETVPEGHVFVLGDNRPNSTDSRHLGVIPIDDIVGIASWTYWPLNEFSKVN